MINFFIYILIPIVALTFFSSPVLSAEEEVDLKKYESVLGNGEKFMQKMSDKAVSTYKKMNSSEKLTEKEFNYENSDYKVRVSRGDVLEKAAALTATIKKAIPPMIPEPLVSRYLQIDIYPKTPLVGMLHVAMTFSVYKSGMTMVGGTMDIAPGTIIKEDLDEISKVMEEVVKRHKGDLEKYRSKLLKGEHRERLKGAGVGLSFYAQPFLELTQENMNFVKDAVETQFDSYIKLIDKRKNDKYAQSDIDEMFAMRRRWLEKEFFWDKFPSLGITPYEVWSLQDLPPEVRF